MVVNFEAIKNEREYFKNKLICVDKIEKFLRTQISENKFKIKTYQNSSKMMNNN